MIWRLSLMMVGLMLPSVVPAEKLGEVEIRAHGGNRAALKWGYGYDLRKHRPISTTCVNIKKHKKLKGGDGWSDSSYSVISSRSEYANTKGISGGAKAGLNMGVFSAEVGYNKGKSTTHRINGQSKAMMASKVILDESRELKVGTVSLKPKYIEMLKDKSKGLNEFRKVCGDGLIFRRQQAAEFVGLASFAHTKSSTTTKKSQGGSLGGTFKGFGGSKSIDTKSKSYKELANSNLIVTIEKSGTKDVSATSFAELVDAFKKFKKSKNTTHLYRVWVLPYSEIVEDWPVDEDPFPSAENIALGKMMDTIWNLEDIVDEAAFIEEYADYFALGSDSNTRTRSLNGLKRFQKEWRKQVEELRPRATACYEGDTKACSLAPKFNTIDFDALRAELPERYSVNCKDFAKQLDETNFNTYKAITDEKQTKPLEYIKPIYKGKKKKDRKRLSFELVPKFDNGRYTLDLIVTAKKDWIKKPGWFKRKLGGKKSKKFTTLWHNKNAPIKLINERLTDHGLEDCRFAKKPKAIKSKTATVFGSRISLKEHGVSIGCNVGEKHHITCEGIQVNLSELPLPTAHVADLEMDKLYGPKGAKRKTIYKKRVSERLKKLKAQREKTKKQRAKRKKRKALQKFKKRFLKKK